MAPWLPIAMLLASVAVTLILRVRVGGFGLSCASWASSLLLVGLASVRWPAYALSALVCLLPVAAYLRYDTWLGKSSDSLFSAVILVGVALSRDLNWRVLLRGRQRQVAVPTLAFSAVLGLSVAVVLLQRSPFFASVMGSGWTGGVFAPDWVTLLPQSTLPVVRAGRFLLGPMAGLVFLSFFAPERDAARGHARRDTILTVFLLTSAVHFAVACGQVYVPGFPIATLREPVSGFFHNPVGLSLLMTLAAPVALAVSLGPARIRWLRPLAAVTVVLIALLFIPIRQRSANLGVAAGIIGMLVATGLLLVRNDRRRFWRIVAAAVVVAVLLAVGLAEAVARDRQWREALTAIADSPLSAAWLGVGVRGETNRLAVLMVADRPLGGLGLGGFEAALPAYYDRYGPAVQRYDYHSILNHPLHMLVDVGVFGFVANLWLLGAFLVPPLRALLARTAPRADEADLDTVAIGCTAGGAAVFFVSIWTGEWMYDAVIGITTFVLLALARPASPLHEGRRGAPAIWAIVVLPMGHVLTLALGV